ncbi:MAG: hypothetical protein ACREO0_15100 [Pseudoxanthomonas sp.]
MNTSKPDPDSVQANYTRPEAGGVVDGVIMSAVKQQIEYWRSTGDANDRTYARELELSLRLAAAAAAAPPAAAVGGDIYGWLIENGKSVPNLRYRTMEGGLIGWTEDANTALRFARRIDAENFAQEDEDAWRIVEHGWHTSPAVAVPVEGEPATCLYCSAPGVAGRQYVEAMDYGEAGEWHDTFTYVPPTGVGDGEVTLYRASRQVSEASQGVDDAMVKRMVDRFLGWRLPNDFAPDAGISFKQMTDPNWQHDTWPTGTNLLHAGQVKEMFEYCLSQSANAGEGHDR